MLNDKEQRRYKKIMRNETRLIGTWIEARLFLEEALPKTESAKNLINLLNPENNIETRIGAIYRVLERPYLQGTHALSHLATAMLKSLGESMQENDDPAFLQHVIKKLKLDTKGESVELSKENLVSMQNKNDLPFVFISYANDDVKVARLLHLFLEKAGFEVWRDETHINGNWVNSIYDADEGGLSICDRMVVLMSNASMPDRPEVFMEWNQYLNVKCIHPLLLEDCEIHPRLTHINYVDARHNLNSAISKLVNKLSSDCFI